MPVSDAPTRELGRVEAVNLMPWLVDPVENVPDLIFPASVATYAKMRRDPTVKSVLNAYVLPILRAPWHVDRRGATDTAARVVADSLGLPVLGDPEPEGPISTRWVRWLDHLRLALRDLVYGFMPFEPVYDVTTGTAYLAGLPERMPWSLSEIGVDERGNLTGITQVRTGKTDITIPADRLLFYVHDREGAQWTGTSLLRETFAPWLFKTDALRGQSRTLRRFGTGVPVMEPLPGTNPTAAQVIEAQRLAVAFRGDSDRAGATTPGFRLRIVGIEGTLPDHLPFLRYLDEQIARATLTSVLDLGNTDNGSRALGTVFLDLLVQAMQAVAEEHAVIASQLARRLTDFNEGPDAEAPLIVVGDVGSSRQALAETIASLVQAGALTLDGPLEGWVRDAFDLPAKDPNTPPPAPAPAPPVGVPAPAEAPPLAVAAADGSPSRGGIARQGGWPYRRDLTPIEAAAGLDPLALDVTLDQMTAAFLTRWPDLSAPIRGSLLDTVSGGDLAQLAGLLPPYGDLADALADGMLDGYDAGVLAARGEARAQGVRVADPGPPDGAAMGATASLAAASMATSLTGGVMREAMRLAGPSTPTSTVTAGVDAYLTGLSNSFPRDVAAGVFADAIHAGRVAVMRAHATGPPGGGVAAAAGDLLGSARYYASEIRDQATCPACLEIDGTEFGSLEEAEAAYPAGGYLDCAGRLRCRGIIFAEYGETP